MEQRLMGTARTRALKATWLATQITGRLSARLSEPFVSRLWFSPWPVPVGERGIAKQREWVRSTERFIVETRLGPISAFEAGAGPSVLLVHGWGEQASFLGAFVEPLVDSGFRVVGVDMPGHGESSWRQTNLFEWADALIDAADQLGGVHGVVAHSIGGAVSTLALSKGLSAGAAALIAPPSELENVVTTFGFMYRLPPRALKGLRRNIERRFGRTVWDELQIQRLAADIDVPVLIVHDEDDGQVDIKESRALAAVWHGSRLLITSGLGHDKVMRDPEVVSAVVSYLKSSLKTKGHISVANSLT